MNGLIGLIASVCIAAVLCLSGCTSLGEGECKRDSHCDHLAKARGELWACYKEPPDAGVGRCMRVKEAKRAHLRYQRKLHGECEDKDGDGVKAGDGCDPPVDCNDSDKTVKPAAAEICDTKDNDCDGLINEGLARCVGTVLGGKQDPVAQFMISLPAGVDVAPSGEIWVTDQHGVYRLDRQGKAARFAGGNKPGADDKTGKLARFNEPVGLAVDASGTVYVAECRNNCVRRITPDGQVRRWAGKCSKKADETGLDKDGNWDEAYFWCPTDVAFDRDGSLLVVDKNNSKIKRITKDRKVVTVAGAGGKEDADGYIVFGHSNGPALKAELNEPTGIAVGKDGSVYIADTKNHCIRMLKNGRVSDFAGLCKSGSAGGGHRDGPASKALFRLPQSVDMDAKGAIWVADTGNHCVRLIKRGRVSTVAGKPGERGYYDGSVNEALFNEPWTVSVAQGGSAYVVDFGNSRIRRVAP